MNFNHLEYAAAIAKYGSISRAAQELLVSQPYLSGMLKGLEDELGYQIFKRDRIGVLPTAQGQLFLSSATLILKELEHIKSYQYELTSLPLHIATFYSGYVMNSYMHFRLKALENPDDRLKEMGNKEVLASVSSGEYNVGLIFYAAAREEKYLKMVQDLNLKSCPLLETMPLFVVMAKHHPAADLKSFDMDSLLHYPYVSYSDASSLQYLQLWGLDQHPSLLAISDRAGFYDALRSGQYLSILALFGFQQSEEFIYVPLSETQFFLNSRYVTRQNYRFSKKEADFLSFLSRINVTDCNT